MDENGKAGRVKSWMRVGWKRAGKGQLMYARESFPALREVKKLSREEESRVFRKEECRAPEQRLRRSCLTFIRMNGPHRNKLLT